MFRLIIAASRGFSVTARLSCTYLLTYLPVVPIYESWTGDALRTDRLGGNSSQRLRRLRHAPEEVLHPYLPLSGYRFVSLDPGSQYVVQPSAGRSEIEKNNSRREPAARKSDD